MPWQQGRRPAVFWGPRAQFYVAMLTGLLLLALVVEWWSQSSVTMHVKVSGSLADSRQLQMQQLQQQAQKAAAAAAGSSGGSSSSGAGGSARAAADKAKAQAAAATTSSSDAGGSASAAADKVKAEAAAATTSSSDAGAAADKAKADAAASPATRSTSSSSTGGGSSTTTAGAAGPVASPEPSPAPAASPTSTPTPAPVSSPTASAPRPAAAAPPAAGGKSVPFAAVHPDAAKSEVRKLKQTVHGHMQKKGHLAWSHWSTRHTEERFDSFLSWRINRTLHGPGPASKESYTCAAADHPPRPFPGCHVFINHHYKFIYIRSPKAASTSIVDELGECNNQRTRGHKSPTCMGMHSSWEFYYPESNITEMWRDYFVFGFVRNPWKRAYSLFKYMQSDGCMPGLNTLRAECQIKWGDFCADPWTASDRVHDAGCLHRSKSYMYFHMMDQHHCMVTESGDWAVDFVGRVEEANTDWKEVVKEINKRRLPEFAELKTNELVPQNVRPGTVSSPYSGENAHCLDAVSRWYACDIDRFGYLAPQPITPAPAATTPAAAASPAPAAAAKSPAAAAPGPAATPSSGQTSTAKKSVRKLK